MITVTNLQTVFLHAALKKCGQRELNYEYILIRFVVKLIFNCLTKLRIIQHIFLFFK